MTHDIPMLEGVLPANPLRREVAQLICQHLESTWLFPFVPPLPALVFLTSFALLFGHGLVVWACSRTPGESSIIGEHCPDIPTRFRSPHNQRLVDQASTSVWIWISCWTHRMALFLPKDGSQKISSRDLIKASRHVTVFACFCHKH